MGSGAGWRLLPRPESFTLGGMSVRPRTCYARSGGAHVAYQVTGEGPVDLVLTPGFTSTFSYDLTPAQNGTRITLRHEGGFALPLICANICLGWETSFTRLAELLAVKTAAG